jgi:hypothetical protein
MSLTADRFYDPDIEHLSRELTTDTPVKLTRLNRAIAQLVRAVKQTSH